MLDAAVLDTAQSDQPDFGDNSNKWVRIDGGAFMMGSPFDEPCRFSNEWSDAYTRF